MILRRTTRMSPQQRRLTLAAPRPERGFTSGWSTAAGMRLHVRQRTDEAGPVWVLLHGLAVSHRYLMPTAAALPGRVLVPDLPGFGLSEAPGWALTVGQHADVIAAWMDAAGLAGAHLLGNSFGCQVAVELAVRRPDLVASLILVGPTADPSALTSSGQVGRWMRDMVREDPRQIPMMAADIRDAGAYRILRTLHHCVRHRIDQRLRLVDVPVLVLRGEFDTIAPPGWVERAAASARHACADFVPGAAHNAVTTAGEVVAAKAAAFVRRAA